MFRRFFRRGPEPLTGAPRTRRLKSYSAASGYAYQYYYLGHRRAHRGTEYVFEASAGGSVFQPVSVVVDGAAVALWEARKGRALIAAEQYAIAKMALFQAFDERASPASLRDPVRVRSADVDAILETLGIE